MVVALGDTQIDFDYVLAHGIYDGLIRIDTLFEQMEIFDGKIQYFDPDEYMATIDGLMRGHKEGVIAAASRQMALSSSALGLAQLHLRQAVIMVDDEPEKRVFNAILNEIEARQSYASACDLFAKYHDSKHHIIMGFLLDTLVSKFNNLHTDLLKAHNGLPGTFVIEREKTQELLTYMADSWKQIGNDLSKNNRRAEAVNAYKKVMDIYNLPGFQGQHRFKEFPIYSNLAIAYNSQEMYSEAIAAATNGLDVYGRCSSNNKPSMSVYEKIVFNLIKALCGQAQNCLILKNNDEAKSLHTKAVNLITTHQSKLSDGVRSEARSLTVELQKSLHSILRRSLMQPRRLELERSISVPDENPEVERQQTPCQLVRSSSESQVAHNTPLRNLKMLHHLVNKSTWSR